MGWSLAGGQLSGSEQQRITGQEEPDEQPCFGDQNGFQLLRPCTPARPTRPEPRHRPG
jgi:hypothetical protein